MKWGSQEQSLVLVATGLLRVSFPRFLSMVARVRTLEVLFVMLARENDDMSRLRW